MCFTYNGACIEHAFDVLLCQNLRTVLVDTPDVQAYHKTRELRKAGTPKWKRNIQITKSSQPISIRSTSQSRC
nr:MAG TPA: hypothetical protein [Caudoviricetes sp.]